MTTNPANPTPEKKAYKDHKKPSFLKSFAKHGTIFRAAEGVGISRDTVYEWRRTDPAFAKAFEMADQEVTERLEDAAISRALRGSDTLTIFLLKCRKPQRYTEHHRHEIESAQVGELTSLVISLLKQNVPDSCPSCRTHLGFKEGLGRQMLALSAQLRSNPPPTS